MIKAIFFDYDGVLTTDRTGSITTNRYLSKVSGVDYESIQKAFSNYNDDLILGKTTHRAIWEAICESIGHDLDFSLLEQAFLSTPANDAMFELARKLSNRYAVGIITDNKRDRIDCLRKAQRLDELFSPVVVSAELGIGKKSSAIFEKALQPLRINSNEAVFVDNTPANLVVAEQLGMHTYLHDDELNDVGRLARTLADRYGLLFD
ncbi:haloacid dehalogenase [Burkholderia lata]|uniref:Haloacid dehalogenase n=1 Tax=Burkholderia lata (strain ATCC 17760 / DSM 23089 / LMG 22485 / NCIMB 9086 / R18194 / 383) TaxID=482957 RepID=A0A6P2XDQ6_BURL3|nr:HAD-IA family hydrolase [Burkholderia lata]VWD07771.1 haloacid dehalogenase [Burkholderia lata]